MIDLHCHILPGIDDGPGTMDEAVELARAAVAGGTTHVVATPHVSARYPDHDATAIARATRALADRLRLEGVPLEVSPGAEVAVRHTDDLGADELLRLGLGGGPWLLTECPSSPFGGRVERSLLRIADSGARILLAHPERVPAFREDPELLEDLVDRGMRCQLTASSLAGRFGAEVQQSARALVDRGLVHVVASDAHSAQVRRPNALAYLRDEGYVEEWIDWWTAAVPATLLASAALPPRPSGPPRRGRLARALRRS